jgi:hypothetical protein
MRSIALAGLAVVAVGLVAGPAGVYQSYADDLIPPDEAIANRSTAVPAFRPQRQAALRVPG